MQCFSLQRWRTYKSGRPLCVPTVPKETHGPRQQRRLRFHPSTARKPLQLTEKIVSRSATDCSCQPLSFGKALLSACASGSSQYVQSFSEQRSTARPLLSSAKHRFFWALRSDIRIRQWHFPFPISTVPGPVRYVADVVPPFAQPRCSWGLTINGGAVVHSFQAMDILQQWKWVKFLHCRPKGVFALLAVGSFSSSLEVWKQRFG